MYIGAQHTFRTHYLELPFVARFVRAIHLDLPFQLISYLNAVNTAKSQAEAVHSGEPVRDEGLPSISHPQAVNQIVLSMLSGWHGILQDSDAYLTAAVNMQVLAWMHDTLEIRAEHDTDIKSSLKILSQPFEDYPYIDIQPMLEQLSLLKINRVKSHKEECEMILHGYGLSPEQNLALKAVKIGDVYHNSLTARPPADKMEEFIEKAHESPKAALETVARRIEKDDNYISYLTLWAKEAARQTGELFRLTINSEIYDRIKTCGTANLEGRLRKNEALYRQLDQTFK